MTRIDERPQRVVIGRSTRTALGQEQPVSIIPYGQPQLVTRLLASE